MGVQTVPKGWRYSDHVPYSTPARLEDLHGPAAGTVRAHAPIDTSPNPVYDLGDPRDVRLLYAAVVREGLPGEQEEFLDPALLRTWWRRLTLPERCRAIWEAKFPELAAA